MDNTDLNDLNIQFKYSDRLGMQAELHVTPKGAKASTVTQYDMDNLEPTPKKCQLSRKASTTEGSAWEFFGPISGHLPLRDYIHL